MNDDFDPRDETLAEGLRALAPAEFELDPGRALGSMRPAFHRARARRRLAVSSAALGVVAVFVVGAAMLRSEPASKLNIRQRSHASLPTLVQPSSTTLEPTTTEPPATSSTTLPRTPTTTTRSQQQLPGSGSAPTSTTPVSTRATAPRGTGETTTTFPPSSTKTYKAIGGHATITFANGRLTLVSYAPAAGYQPDLRTNTSSEIEIRFSNGKHESRIRIRVQDGALRPEISEN